MEYKRHEMVPIHVQQELITEYKKKLAITHAESHK